MENHDEATASGVTPYGPAKKATLRDTPEKAGLKRDKAKLEKAISNLTVEDCDNNHHKFLRRIRNFSIMLGDVNVPRTVLENVIATFHDHESPHFDEF